MGARPVVYMCRMICGHVQSVESTKGLEPGEEVFCRFCRAPQFVVWSSMDYRVVCLGCVVRKRFGRAPLAMQLFASQHQRKFPTHPIRLLEGNKIIEVRPAKRNLTELPFEDDKPPY